MERRLHKISLSADVAYGRIAQSKVIPQVMYYVLASNTSNAEKIALNYATESFEGAASWKVTAIDMIFEQFLEEK